MLGIRRLNICVTRRDRLSAEEAFSQLLSDVWFGDGEGMGMENATAGDNYYPRWLGG